MILNIAVCDDDRETTLMLCKRIDEILNNNAATYTVSHYFDGTNLLADFSAGSNFDVIFLDIEMPEQSGMDVAKFIRQNNSDVLIVFVTNHPHFMAASFKVEAFDFLTKPVAEDDLRQVLERCMQKYKQKNQSIAIRTALGVSVLQLNEIVYISSDRHYVNFYLTNNTVTRAQLTLNQVGEMLKPYRQFARCHKSFLVNLDYASEVQRLSVILKPVFAEAVSLPVSRSYKQSIKENFLAYHLKKIF